MPNHKSAEKRLRQNVKRRERNRLVKASARTSVKRVVSAVEAGNPDAAQEALRKAEKVIASAASKGVLHKRAASRKISRLAQQVQAVKQ